MRPGPPWVCTLSLTALLISGSAWGGEWFRARLSPLPTTPQTVTELTGQGEVRLSLDGNMLAVQGNFSGMSSAATVAHLHLGPPAQPGPALHVLQAEPAPAGGLSAAVELTDEQVQALRTRGLYVQVHSVQNPAGELRGWIFSCSHFDCR